MDARRVAFGLVLVLLGVASAGAARKPAPPRCGGGYYLLDGAPLVPGTTTGDVLSIGAGGASTLSGCPVVAASVFRGGKRGSDQIVVKWPACGTLRKAVLKARISADCASVTGSFKAKGAKRRRFTARDGLPAELREPWDTAIEPLPEGFVMLSPREFVDASRQPGFRLVSPRVYADDEAAAAAADAANGETLAAFAASNPSRADYLSIGVDPAEPSLARMEDGNYRLTIYDEDGNGSDVVTMGPRDQRAVRANTIRTFPSDANQRALYADRWSWAVEHVDPTLPPPAAAASMPADEVAALNTYVADSLPQAQASATVPGESIPDTYPARCSLEVGAGAYTDGSNYCGHAANGLWNTATWPLKYWDTCVKAQAVRGSCVSFAITAGREVRFARAYDRWINLSEQHLYFAAKGILQPRRYGDGLDASKLLQQIFDVRYEQPLEADWDYNPSNSRIDDAARALYYHSCLNYGPEYCSDTAGQGRTVCMNAGASVVCAMQPAPVAGMTVHSTDQPYELWDPTNPAYGLQNVLGALHLSLQPVVLSFEVVKPFDVPSAGGFVKFRPEQAKVCGTDAVTDPANPRCLASTDCECSRGTHAVLAVGAIDNKYLPATAPQGAGGGYVIIKNSWGCAAGDGGYYYMPYDFARSFVVSARAVGNVEITGPLPDQPIDDSRFDYHPVPPQIRIVEPHAGAGYVAGQGVPLSLDGVDFQYDRYALLGPVVWTSSLQGQIGSGVNSLTTLSQGTHVITATYTGKTGATAQASVVVSVGAQPADLPPTAYFFDYTVLPPEQCPVACSFSCIMAFGQGSDPEDGLLTSAARVRWYLQPPQSVPQLVASGASQPGQGKFLGCARLCGGLFRFTLEVEDSQGQTGTSRRELSTPGCVN
jgi:hypothetical protein